MVKERRKGGRKETIGEKEHRTEQEENCVYGKVVLVKRSVCRLEERRIR